MGDFMKYLIYLSLSLLIITVLAVLIIGSKSKKPFRYALTNSLFGVVLFLGIYFSKKYVPIDVGINYYTVLGSVVFGVPGVICILILNLLF